MKGDQVIRKIRYSEFRHKDYSVEVIWTGLKLESSLLFKLRPSSSLTAFENYALPVLGNSVLQSSVNEKGQLKLPDSEETWTLYDQNPGAQPLWEDQRYQVPSRGNSNNFALSIIKKLGLDRANQAFYEWAKDSTFSGQISDQHWIIYDPTDFESYRKNQNTLIISNKTLNPLSLAEALNKRNAYAPTLSQKAQYFENETANYNLNQVGLLEIAQVDAEKRKIRSELEGDAAL